MIRHYIEFLYHGLLFTDFESKEVPNRELPGIIPSRAYAYRFYDIEESEQNKRVLRSDRFNLSGCYYPDAELYTLAQIKRFFPTEEILIGNMEHNKIKKVVWTRVGNYMEYDPDTDVLVELKGEN